MKKLEKYGIAAQDFKTAQDAASHTYMTNDGRAVSTPLIFPDNPYNSEVESAKYILDIGCGTGRNLSWIMENTSAHYVGIDPNESMHRFFWDCQDTKWKDRVTLVSNFDEIDPVIKFDVAVCTFVFQHITYRPAENQMNITDITLEAFKHCRDDAVWIMYEHDWEEKWVERWCDETGVYPQVYKRDYAGIPDLAARGAHHLIIFKRR